MKYLLTAAVAFTSVLYANGQNTFPSSGNVGIGTTSPLAPLDIKTSSGSLRFNALGASSAKISSTAALGLETTSTSFIQFLAGGTEIGRFTNDGKLGIGTNSPNEKLHVNGNAEITGDIIMDYGKSLKVDTDWSGAGEDKILKTGWESSRDDFLDFYVPGNVSQNQTARMSILQNGNVGIGVTAPDEKLEVNGTVRTKEVVVESSPWPDYVFKEDYDLRSLEETEAYIKANKHLPEMPSAEEVDQNGIRVGEMNALLLKKIEELTLHQIEMMKIIKAQQKEIEHLKTANQKTKKY